MGVVGFLANPTLSFRRLELSAAYLAKCREMLEAISFDPSAWEADQRTDALLNDADWNAAKSDQDLLDDPKARCVFCESYNLQ